MPDQTFENIDAGRGIDWGRTSEDYDRHRPGPPESFYARLRAHEIGLGGQRILDLGTGTGLLARRFAEQGARVQGIDLAEGQIAMARAAAAREGHQIEFQVAAAESTPFARSQFDVVSANQCWMYFDLDRTIAEVLRVMKPDGKLLVSHFSFLPYRDSIVRASESLVLKYNPEWSGANWNGVLASEPRWSRNDFDLVGLFVYDESIAFNRESWRGRMRALRGIAASLSADEVRAFDEEHKRLLSNITPDHFQIWHRIHAHIFQPKNQ